MAMSTIAPRPAHGFKGGDAPDLSEAPMPPLRAGLRLGGAKTGLLD